MIYIKFVHKDDVYALDPGYSLKPEGEPSPSLFCPRCGDTLFIPVKLPEDVTVSQPAGEMLRARDMDHKDILIKADQQKLPSIAVYKSIDYTEQARLKDFTGMAFVDDKGFELLIKGWSHVPVQHECVEQD